MRRQLGLLALFHLIANALILWLGYYWLGVNESETSTLLWSGFVALVLIAGTCCAYGASLVFFGGRENAGTVGAWRTAARNLGPLVLAALVGGLLYWLLSRVTFQNAAFRVASWMTLTLRKPVTPASVLRVFNGVFWLVQWMVIPVIALPVIGAIARFGWKGFRAFGQGMRVWRTWIVVPVLLACAFLLPLRIVRWVPEVDGFWGQSASFVARAGVAYLLFGAAWLLLAFTTLRGKPEVTQPSTVVSP
jgi:hypothetical protein